MYVSEKQQQEDLVDGIVKSIDRIIEERRQRSFQPSNERGFQNFPNEPPPPYRPPPHRGGFQLPINIPLADIDIRNVPMPPLPRHMESSREWPSVNRPLHYATPTSVGEFYAFADKNENIPYIIEIARAFAFTFTSTANINNIESSCRDLVKEMVRVLKTKEQWKDILTTQIIIHVASRLFYSSEFQRLQGTSNSDLARQLTELFMRNGQFLKQDKFPMLQMLLCICGIFGLRGARSLADSAGRLFFDKNKDAICDPAGELYFFNRNYDSTQVRTLDMLWDVFSNTRKSTDFDKYLYETFRLLCPSTATTITTARAAEDDW